MTPSVRVLGHRGARAVAPENTRAGILRALADGADGVELDVRQLADERPVLLHDATLERTTNGRGPLAALDTAGLAIVDAGVRFAAASAGERVPHLADVLEEFLGRTALAIEMKEVLRPRALDVLSRAHSARPAAPLLLASFQPEAVAAARPVLPEVHRALILEAGAEAPSPAMAADLALWGIFANFRDVDDAYASAVLARGLVLWVYTVNDPGEAAALAARGVTGIITDDPARILARLRPRR